MSEKSGFSDEEKMAMSARAAELRREQEGKRSKKQPEADVLEAIAQMSNESAEIAINIHKLVAELAPQLSAKTYYGMPAYANKDGKVVLFFQSKDKFKTRYSTLGFNDLAQLDDGDMWPTAFGILNWSENVETKIRELIVKAVQ
ncbi:hypothetical protein ESZ50_00690 [Weissella muntiaci]|uniref:DUF1801 domain-containing protein n=1 Tax=Weissella muntiaci TaxID=2508881 RepID=A0A6C2CAP8_9LACO|nr:hypothetical protein [Weissella muntiaci]TYC51084.1 hypothetical protein ESZ50_00690 [Weissella muntiaci]